MSTLLSKIVNLRTIQTFALAIGVIFASTQAQAKNLELDLGLAEAEELAHELKDFGVKNSLRGTFKREVMSNEPIFEIADALVKRYISIGTLRVEQLSVLNDQVSFEVRDFLHSHTFLLTSNEEKVQASELLSNVKNSEAQDHSTLSRIIPATQLIIEEGSRWNKKTKGSFVSLSKSVMGADGNFKVEAGQSHGPFTLTVFGSSFGNSIKMGVAANLKVIDRNGWTVNIRAEQNMTTDSRINYVEGTFQQGQNLNFHIQKSLNGELMYVSGGVNFNWTHSHGHSTSNQTAYVGVGRKFKNKAGKEIGSIDIIGSKNIGVSDGEWFVGIRGSFRF